MKHFVVATSLLTLGQHNPRPVLTPGVPSPLLDMSRLSLLRCNSNRCRSNSMARLHTGQHHHNRLVWDTAFQPCNSEQIFLNHDRVGQTLGLTAAGGKQI